MFKDEFSYNPEGSYLEFTNISRKCEFMDMFVQGDLLDFGEGMLYHVGEYDMENNRLKVIRSNQSTGTVLPIGKLSTVTIVKSGRANRLDENIGSYTLHSQDNNIAMKEDQPSLRWGSNDLTNALNVKVAELHGDAGDFVLDGIYSGINIESLASEVPESCKADLKSATIKNVKVIYKKSGELQLKIMSFDVQCEGGSWFTINEKQ